MRAIRSAIVNSLLLFFVLGMWPGSVVWAAYCTPAPLTVVPGGTVTWDISTCDGPDDFGFGEGPVVTSGGQVAPTRGQALVGPWMYPSSQQFVSYTHNGSATTTDTFTLTDQDNNPVVFNVTISGASVIPVLPTALVLQAGAAVSIPLLPQAGVAPFVYTLAPGSVLPAGLTLSSAGVISGKPTVRGSYSFGVTVTDANALSATHVFVGVMAPPDLTLNPSTIQMAVGVAASAQLTVPAGVAPLKFLLESGTLPLGLSLSAEGLITGVPTAASSATVSVRVTDGSVDPANPGLLAFLVQPLQLVVSTATVPGAPTSVAASPGNGLALVSFAAPGSDGGSNITQYIATCAAAGQLTQSMTGAGSPLTVNGLVNGVPYGCSVRAQNSVGAGPASAVVPVTPVGPPSAPQLLSAARQNGAALLTFNPSASNGGSPITGYAGVCNGVGQSGTAPTITVGSLSNGVLYNCLVRVSNALGSTDSAVLSVTPATTPSAPLTPVGTAGNAQISVQFAAPASNGGDPVTGYRATCGSVVVPGTSTSIVVTGLTNGTSYACTVEAQNTVGWGAVATAPAVVPVGPPGAPTGLSATPGNQLATLSFVAPASNGGSAITEYTATCASPAGTKTGTNAASPITVTGMVNGTAYSCTVTAKSQNGGTGAASAAVSVTPATTPDAPLSPVATAGNAQISVQFNAPANNGGIAVTGYRATCGSQVVLGATAPIVVTGLTNGTSYACTVAAQNTVGWSAPATAAAVVPVGPPDAPTGLSAAPGNQSATLSFVAPASTGGSTITAYTATCTSPAGTKTGTAAASPVTVSGMVNGTAYSCTIKTTSQSGGDSVASASVSVTPADVPGAPTNVSATRGNEKATIVFTAPASNGGSAITDYVASCLPGTVTKTGTASPLEVTGLTNGTAYSCSVVAKSAAGDSAASAAVNVTPATLPGAPTISALTSGNAELLMAFAAPASDGGSAITKYSASCNGGAVTAAGTASPIKLTGVSNGVSYSCTVTAENDVGVGSASAAVTGMPSVKTYSAPSPTGSGVIEATLSGGGDTCGFDTPRFIPVTGDPASPPAGTAPAGVNFPHGMFAFKTLGCTAGSTAQITIKYPTAIPAAPKYWKYGPQPGKAAGWYVHPATFGANTVTYAITDGAAGDDDLTVNGVMVDPGALGSDPAAVVVTTAAIPTNAQWMLVLLSLALAGLAAVQLAQRRRKVAQGHYRG